MAEPSHTILLNEFSREKLPFLGFQIKIQQITFHMASVASYDKFHKVHALSSMWRYFNSNVCLRIKSQEFVTNYISID